MATYRKKLLDKDGNTIIPALAGDETGWVNTADLADSSVTAAKFASGAVNSATKTSNNLTPTADTPTAWSTLLGGDGYYWTYYSANSFTNQPSQYGFLETIITGTQIYQRWKDHADGVCFYRGGNDTGWYGSSSASGAFRQVLDDSGNSVNIRTSDLTFNGCEPTPQSQAFGFMAVKYGKMVFLGGNINITESKAAYSDLVNLPISLSPITTITTPAGNKLIDIRYGGSNTGGYIQCHSALSNGDTLQIAATYISR